MSNVFDREEVVRKLKDKVCLVKFMKKDGSERVMRATLMESVLKNLTDSNGTSRTNRTPNPNQVCCIDVEIDAWRSFNLDTLISIE